MGAVDRSVATTLDCLVPPRPHPERWEEVVARAHRTRGRRPAVVAPAAAAAAAAAAIVLAWPFGGGGPTASILDRAAAAIGNGAVVHVVVESGWGGTLVDLRSGARTTLHGQDELWYDPERGVRDVSSFDGVIQSESVYPPGRVPYLDKALAGLATGYRDALRNGSARVLAPAVVDGKPVYWIRVDTQLLPDASDGKEHEWAHDVAVSRSDYRPVATRETRDGNASPDGDSTIVSLETLPAGSGDFARSVPDRNGIAMSSEHVGTLEPAQATAALGATAVWAGEHVAGLDLARVWKDERREGYDARTRTWQKTYSGVSLWYGEAPPSFAGAFPAGAVSTPFVRVAESLTLDDGFQRGVRGYSPPEGSLLVVGRTIGLMQIGGVHVALEASSEDVLVAAARALTPIP
jgi:hypothetical protein